MDWVIRFGNRSLAQVRQTLLRDLENEAYAVLLGKTERVGGLSIIACVDLLFPSHTDYISQSRTHLNCASSDNLGHQSVLSFGGSGSSLIKFMRFQFRGASAA